MFETPLGGLWGLATVIGPILFVIVLAWAIMRNRKAGDRNRQIAEKSAGDLRDQLTAEREQREGKSE